VSATHIVQAKQRGFWPRIILVVCLVATLYFGCAMVYGIQFFIGQLVTRQPLANDWFISFAAIMILFSVFIWYGLGMAGAFSTIIITETSLQTRHPLGFSSTYPWHEIKAIVPRRFPIRCTAVILKRRGAYLFWPWKLYFNYLYGLLVQLMQPVILIAPGLENHDQVLHEIRARSQVESP
jgi:hypothetical protein